MAWTKMKTVAVIGVAVILVTGTTGLVIEHRHPSKEPVPGKPWAFVGFDTPEGAPQSAFWAMSKGDMKTLLYHAAISGDEPSKIVGDEVRSL